MENFKPLILYTYPLYDSTKFKLFGKYGIINPIIVGKFKGKYFILDGVKRYLFSKKKGLRLKYVEIDIRNLWQGLMISVGLNKDRLNRVEIANIVAFVDKRFKRKNLVFKVLRIFSIKPDDYHFNIYKYCGLLDNFFKKLIFEGRLNIKYSPFIYKNQDRIEGLYRYFLSLNPTVSQINRFTEFLEIFIEGCNGDLTEISLGDMDIDQILELLERRIAPSFYKFKNDVNVLLRKYNLYKFLELASFYDTPDVFLKLKLNSPGDVEFLCKNLKQFFRDYIKLREKS